MEFHTVPSYPKYEVSRSGVVRNKVTGKTLKTHADAWGQIVCAIVLEDGRHTTKTIHRILAETYLGLEPGSKARVSHKNGNKSDNRLQNIQVETRTDIYTRTYKKGRVPAGPTGLGINIYEASNGLYLGQACSTNAASKLTGVGQSTISLIINGKYKTDAANGFRFEKA